MLKFLKIFLIFIASYHILNTVIVYGILGGQHGLFIAVIKDFIWLVFTCVIAILNSEKVILFVKKYKELLILFILLILRSLMLSLREGKTFYDIAVGYKYDLYFLFILISSIFIGTLFNKKEINNLINFFIKFVLTIIGIGFIWQIAKFAFPNFFHSIGYGPIGDYVLGQNPPIYYRTGPGGNPRLSGIFSGPNNFGYLLVLLFSLILYHIKNTKNKLYSFLYSLLYIPSCILTLSRGVFIGAAAQLLLFFKKHTKQLGRSALIIVVMVIIFGIGILSVFKFGSTIDHLKESWNGLEKVLENPIGYGLGTAGPSIHYQGYILPENTYLQILLDLGVVGFMLWITFFLVIGKIIYEIFKNNKNNHGLIYLELLNFGIIGILVEGLFLHVFEDSMVNYIFFILWGILIGYYYQTKTKT